MMAQMCIAILIGALATQAAPAGERPVVVEIVPVATEMRDAGFQIGNVRVRFKDGHSEVWTTRGQCLIAKISRNGFVGWTRYAARNRRGVPVNDTVRLMVSKDRWIDFHSGYPFIDDWDTSDDGATLIVRSGFAHGPFRFQLFDVRTQKPMEQTVERPYDELPVWARLLATDKPKA